MSARIPGLLFFVILMGMVSLAQPPDILPINGYLITGVGTHLLLLDASTGQIETLQTTDYPKRFSGTRLNPSGDKLAYRIGLDVQVMQPVNGSERMLSTFSHDNQLGVFAPANWSTDDNFVLVNVSEGLSGFHELRYLDIETGQSILLKQFQRDVTLNEMPDLAFHRIQSASSNPISPEWIALQLVTFPVSTQGDFNQVETTANMIFNRNSVAYLLPYSPLFTM